MRFTTTLAITSVIGAAGTLICYIVKSKKKFRLVGNVSSLQSYPVKACQPLVQQQMEMTKMGPIYDRIFVLLNKNGEFMSNRRYHQMCRIKTELMANHVRVSAAGMERWLELPLNLTKSDAGKVRLIDVFGKKGEGVHVSEEADEWFSTFLEQAGSQLYCMPGNGTPRCSYEKGTFNEEYTSSDDLLAFADGCPILICSETSLMELNKSLERPVSMDRFRPNISISGSRPYDEDEWKEIRMGDCSLKRLYPCTRCVATTVDPQKGVQDADMEPLKSMRKIRPADEVKWPTLDRKPIFGCNYGVIKPGKIYVGDEVWALY